MVALVAKQSFKLTQGNFDFTGESFNFTEWSFKLIQGNFDFTRWSFDGAPLGAATSLGTRM